MAVTSTNARKTVSRPGSGYELLPGGGLFDTANGPLPLDDHASVMGLEFQTPYCGLPQGYDVNCTPGSKSASLTGSFTTATGDPFVVLAGMECGAMTGSDTETPEQYTRRFVTSKLQAYEQRLVENIFSRGLNGQSVGLGNNAAANVVATPGVDNLVNAIQALEADFATRYGLPGMIHLPIAASGQFSAGHLGERIGGKMYTAAGNLVSIGNYAGYSPLNVAPAAGHAWLWITPMVTIWRNDIFVSDWEASIDKVLNQVHRFAERTYIVTYECPSAASAVLADITACC